MTHTEAFDLILASACPANVSPSGLYTFYIDVHCQQWEVLAELVSTLDRIQYKIVSLAAID